MSDGIKICDYRLAGRHVVLNPSVRLLCQRPYPGHPKGCPNFGRQEGCPPSAPMFDAVIDCSKAILVKWAEYDLEAHRQRMWARHPRWSKRQAECCLYWQGRVESKLEDRVAAYGAVNLFGPNRIAGGLYVTYRPEALGVDVTATMKIIGVELEWPPEKIVRKVVLIGETK